MKLIQLWFVIILDRYSLSVRSDNNDTNTTELSAQIKNDSQPTVGQLRLRGGRTLEEGNVEIYYSGSWGSVCDDEWDIADAAVACRQLGFFGGAVSFTTDSYFGRFAEEIWLDNLRCTGYESRLTDCIHDGWRRNDCNLMESAGVVCKPNPPPMKTEPTLDIVETKKNISIIFKNKPVRIKLKNGRSAKEGRVELIQPRNGLICADKWGLREAMVICRQLGLGYAQQAVRGKQFDGGERRKHFFLLFHVTCTGDEESLSSCKAVPKTVRPICENDWAAGVVCADELPDLQPDLDLLRDSIYLHDQSLHYLQCAAEEKCLSSSASQVVSNEPSLWFYRIRRLLRFSTKVFNVGGADFLPNVVKAEWQWHQCHMHYHSMEVFSHYDIIDPKTNRHVAEGHKASFCLEDSDCEEGVRRRYACANYGDQGISPGCWDTYLHDIDCQWIDITDLIAGSYIFKVSINPEYKVAEKNFSNNAVICDLYYNRMQVSVNNCVYSAP